MAAQDKAHQLAAKLREMKLSQAAAMREAGIAETLSYCSLSREQWRSIRTNRTCNLDKGAPKRRLRKRGTGSQAGPLYCTRPKPTF